MTPRTASRYLAVHRFSKSDIVSDFDESAWAKLKITAGAFYTLCEGSPSKEVVEAVFSEAREGWVNQSRLRDISAKLTPKSDEEPEDAKHGDGLPHGDPEDEPHEEPDEEVCDDTDEGHDAPPPPPGPGTLPRDAYLLETFSRAIADLTKIYTKPAAKFTEAAVIPSELRKIADWVNYLADEIERATLRTAA
jgi:hypothetical protein